MGHLHDNFERSKKPDMGYYLKERDPAKDVSLFWISSGMTLDG
jgi:hypothetical protein